MRGSLHVNLASTQLPPRQSLCQFTGLHRRKKSLKALGRRSFFRNVMVVRKPSSLFSDTTSTSRASSFYPPSVFSRDWDSDDEKDNMSSSTSDYAPSRPLSVAIPKSGAVHGPYCPRRPNLREILANTAEAPWTLAAFMAYLSNNHCLETLEFTMDAGRYKKHYAKMMSRGSNGAPSTKDREFVQQLWQRLVDAYIKPNGSREVNLPSNVRDPILLLSPAEAPAEMPPLPEKLDPAVAKIYELMEESVLVPFLNSAYPQTAHPTVSSCPINRSDESIPMTAVTYEDQTEVKRRSRHHRNSPPPQSAVAPYPHSYSPPSPLSKRISAPSYTASHSSSKQRSSAKLSHTTSSPATVAASGSDQNISSGPGMTDDSASTDSPGNGSPTTPPWSPPSRNDVTSPKRDSGMWKALGRLSGVKPAKKKSQGGLKEEQ